MYLQPITIADKDHHLTNQLMPDQLNSDQAQRQSKLADNHALALQVAIQPLDSDAGSDAGIDAVKELAIAVWYRGFVPTNSDLETIRQQIPQRTSENDTSISFLRLLYVLELLSLFPVCRDVTAKHLQTMTDEWQAKVVGIGSADGSTVSHQQASVRWKLPEPTGLLRQALLPLQTRHFADTMGGDHGFAGDDH